MKGDGASSHRRLPADEIAIPRVQAHAYPHKPVALQYALRWMIMDRGLCRVSGSLLVARKQTFRSAPFARLLRIMCRHHPARTSPLEEQPSSQATWNPG